MTQPCVMPSDLHDYLTEQDLLDSFSFLFSYIINNKGCVEDLPVKIQASLLKDVWTSCGILGAVSGGPDSTVLLHTLALLRKYIPSLPILTVTVDHGLRPEAQGEALHVQHVAHQLGLKHEILNWEGPHPKTGIQKKAREKRYELLAELAKKNNIPFLLTAHTADDQAETLLMRLSKGTGLSGLSGIRQLISRNGILHFRPFLFFRKYKLIQTCIHNEWSFFTDPSNSDSRYARSRWRNIQPLLNSEGLTVERLSTLAGRVQRADNALDYYANQLYNQIVTYNTTSSLTLPMPPFMEAPEEVALRVLIRSVHELSHMSFIRLERSENFLNCLRKAYIQKQRLKRSLGQAVLEFKPNKNMLIISHSPEWFRGRRISA